MPAAATAKKTAPAPGKAPAEKRKRGKGLKPGKTSWVHGTKLRFFEARASEWKRANEGGFAALSTFYTEMANLYFLKYGHEMRDWEDLAEDGPDPTDPNTPLPDGAGLTQEQAKKRSEDVILVRKRIAAWYCRKYKGVDKMEQNAFAELLKGVAEHARGQGPRRAQPLHYYSRKFYEERVKARFLETWKVEVQCANDLGKVGKDFPTEIKVRNEVTKQAFAEETDEFKAEMQVGIEAEWVAAMRSWELSHGETELRSAEEFSASLNNAAFYLDPLAVAIRDKFGMNCSILLCGPVGDRGGAIEVRSVHAGTTRGVGGKKWYEFKPLEYEAVEKSMVRFSASCFTEEECRARIVNNSELPKESAPSAPQPPGATPIQRTTSQGTLQQGASGSMQVEGASGAARNPGAGGEGEGEHEGGGEGGNNDDVETPRRHPVWDRRDKMEWNDEMRTAFGAFAMGEEWGLKWEECVDAWLDVESGCGYRNDGGKLGNEMRPAEVNDFIRLKRKWWQPPQLKNVGTKGEEGTFVDNWWRWWMSEQPDGRVLEGGCLSRDENATWKWGDLTRMNGRLGLMLVVAGLLWWGLAEDSAAEERAADEAAQDAAGRVEKREWANKAGWVEAVEEVTWVMKKLVASGELSKKQTRKRGRKAAPKAAPQKKTGARRKGRQGDDDGDDDEDDEEEERRSSDDEEAPPRSKKARVEAVPREARATRAATAAAARPRRTAAKK